MRRSFIIRIFLYSTLFILPFVVLIRGSVYLHKIYFFYPVPAILGGFILTAALLAFYLIFFLKTPAKFFKNRFKISVIVLGVYILYAFHHISAVNVKSGEVAREYTSLHPILRLGLTTLMLMDKDLILTDADRIPEDYDRMGLSAKEHSLHYRQKNGYVHAIDIRTNDRSGIRNLLLKVYFKSMGFQVLRHGGTGDHLHVSLLSHDRPKAF